MFLEQGYYIEDSDIEIDTKVIYSSIDIAESKLLNRKKQIDGIIFATIITIFISIVSIISYIGMGFYIIYFQIALTAVLPIALPVIIYTRRVRGELNE